MFEKTSEGWALPSGLEEVAAPFRRGLRKNFGLRPLDLRKWLRPSVRALRKNLGLRPLDLRKWLRPSGEPAEKFWAAPSGLEEVAGPFRQSLQKNLGYALWT